MKLCVHYMMWPPHRTWYSVIICGFLRDCVNISFAKCLIAARRITADWDIYSRRADSIMASFQMICHIPFSLSRLYLTLATIKTSEFSTLDRCFLKRVRFRYVTNHLKRRHYRVCYGEESGYSLFDTFICNGRLYITCLQKQKAKKKS
jgi:hypothetical protein